MNEILENAAMSLRVGVADAKSTETERVLSAVRSIHAGLALLYKEKLRQLSPPNSENSLLMERITPEFKPDGTVHWVGAGKNTVGNREIEIRFKALGITVDWKKFARVAKLRNNIEHFHTDQPTKTIQEVIGIAFILARDFLTTQLNETPLDLLGEETWHSMLETNELFQKELNECHVEISKFEWPTEIAARAAMDSTCQHCQSSLVSPVGDQLNCRACGEDSDANEVLEQAISEQYAYANYRSVKTGGDALIETCPECQLDAYHVETAKCALCEYTLSHTNCNLCGEYLSVHEQEFSGYCSYCNYKIEKTRDG